jgi:hypothetical protein
MKVTVGDTLACAMASAGFGPCFVCFGHHVKPLPQALARAGCLVVIAASYKIAAYIALELALGARRPALTFGSGSSCLAITRITNTMTGVS